MVEPWLTNKMQIIPLDGRAVGWERDSVRQALLMEIHIRALRHFGGFCA